MIIGVNLSITGTIVLNPPAEEESSDTYGPELMVDGVNFASGYTNTSGTTNAGGMVNLTGTVLPRCNVAFASPLITGREYEVTYTILNYSAGSIVLYVGGAQALASRIANGSYTERFIAAAEDSVMQIRGPSSGRASLDNISLREVNPPSSELSELSWLAGVPSLAEDEVGPLQIGELAGMTSGSTLSLVDDAGGLFTLDEGAGTVDLVGALDYETATSHSITVRETLAGVVNSPRDTVLTINVTDVSLTLPDPELFLTLSAAGEFQGTTLGQLTGYGFEAALSLHEDAGGRFQLSDDDLQAGATPTVAGTYYVTVRQTHPEATNSPHDTVLEVVLE